jgi:hypothetical protein
MREKNIFFSNATSSSVSRSEGNYNPVVLDKLELASMSFAY